MYDFAERVFPSEIAKQNNISEQSAIDFLDSLVGTEVERKYLLKCLDCGFSDGYLLDNDTYNNKCKRCNGNNTKFEKIYFKM